MTTPTPDPTPVREQLLDALDFSYCQGLGYGAPEELLAAYDASRTVPPVDRAGPSSRAGFLDEVTAALGAVPGGPPVEFLRAQAACVLSLLYREWPWLRAEAEDAPPSVDRAAEELAKHVTRAIFALKSPVPPGSEHYRSGWDDGLEAVMDAAREELLRRMAAEAQPAEQPPAGAAALREIADFYERTLNESLDSSSDPRYCTAVRDVVMGLRRRADEIGAEAQPATPDTETPPWARPDTEEEKLAKCRRMAKAMSAPPEPPAEWASTTEWPGRHKRPGDRRIHATAPFIVGSVQRIWTACREHVGSGGTALPHMAVDCRACKQATEPAGSAAAPAKDTPTIPCSTATLRRPHPAHDWEPQPGMTPVHCPGTAPAKEA